MSCCLLLGLQNKVHSLFWDVSRNYASGVGAVVLISKWVYYEPSREAGVTAAPDPSKVVVGVRIPCLAPGCVLHEIASPERLWLGKTARSRKA